MNKKILIIIVVTMSIGYAIYSTSLKVTGTSGSVGSSTSFSNLPPYITVYRYKRIA